MSDSQERLSKEEREQRRERWEQVFRQRWSGDPGDLSATQTALEECMEDLLAADERIGELEELVERLGEQVRAGDDLAVKTETYLYRGGEKQRGDLAEAVDLWRDYFPEEDS